MMPFFFKTNPFYQFMIHFLYFCKAILGVSFWIAAGLKPLAMTGADLDCRGAKAPRNDGGGFGLPQGESPRNDM